MAARKVRQLSFAFGWLAGVSKEAVAALVGGCCLIAATLFMVAAQSTGLARIVCVLAGLSLILVGIPAILGITIRVTLTFFLHCWGCGALLAGSAAAIWTLFHLRATGFDPAEAFGAWFPAFGLIGALALVISHQKLRLAPLLEEYPLVVHIVVYTVVRGTLFPVAILLMYLSLRALFPGFIQWTPYA